MREGGPEERERERERERGRTRQQENGREAQADREKESLFPVSGSLARCMQAWDCVSVAG